MTRTMVIGVASREDLHTCMALTFCAVAPAGQYRAEQVGDRFVVHMDLSRRELAAGIRELRRVRPDIRIAAR